MTGKEVPADIRDEFLEGGAEIDLVRSGLEDVMRSTWGRIADLIEQRPELGDYRTVRQIAEAYEAIGINSEPVWIEASAAQAAARGLNRRTVV
nr:glutamate dehydrogenase [Rhizobium esperanzae]